VFERLKSVLGPVKHLTVIKKDLSTQGGGMAASAGDKDEASPVAATPGKKCPKAKVTTPLYAVDSNSDNSDSSSDSDGEAKKAKNEKKEKKVKREKAKKMKKRAASGTPDGEEDSDDGFGDQFDVVSVASSSGDSDDEEVDLVAMASMRNDARKANGAKNPLGGNKSDRMIARSLNEQQRNMSKVAASISSIAGTFVAPPAPPAQAVKALDQTELLKEVKAVDELYKSGFYNSEELKQAHKLLKAKYSSSGDGSGGGGGSGGGASVSHKKAKKGAK